MTTRAQILNGTWIRRFSAYRFVAALLAGVLIGIVTAHLALWTVIGVVGGIALGFTAKKRKKACCQ